MEFLKQLIKVFKFYTLKNFFEFKIKNILSKKTEIEKKEQIYEPVKILNPGPIITNKDMKPKQIYHRVQLNQENRIRKQLLGTKQTSLGF